MLEKLVHEIRAGGTLETGSLAARLGATPQLVEAMLEHLQRIGLIRNYIRCADTCGGCNLRDACNEASQSSLRLWQSKQEQ